MLKYALAVIATTYITLIWANAPDGEPLPDNFHADQVLVEKDARRLTLIQGGSPVKSYGMVLGDAAASPNGRHVIDTRHDSGKFYLTLHVAADGGETTIHGMRKGLGWLGRLHRLVNWTDGSIALTNLEMDELWGAVTDGTPIELRP